MSGHHRLVRREEYHEFRETLVQNEDKLISNHYHGLGRLTALENTSLLFTCTARATAGPIQVGVSSCIQNIFPILKAGGVDLSGLFLEKGSGLL